MLKHDGKVKTTRHAGAGGKGQHDVRGASGRQAVDMICAIEAIIEVVEGRDTPRHPPHGKDPNEGAMAARPGPRENFETGAAASRGTALPADPAGRAP